MPIRVTAERLDEVRRRIEETRRRLRNLTEAWGPVHEGFLLEVAKQFRTNGRYFLGTPWKPLNPGYARRRKPLPPKPFWILYHTGEMYQSFTSRAHINHVFQPKPDSVILGSRDPRAAAHQKGDPRANLPRREIIKMRKAFRRFALKAIIAYALRRDGDDRANLG